MPKPADPGSKGKAKGKMKLDVCRWDAIGEEWHLMTLPAHAAAKQVANGHAVYAVDGTCPIDAPTFEGDDEAEE